MRFVLALCALVCLGAGGAWADPNPGGGEYTSLAPPVPVCVDQSQWLTHTEPSETTVIPGVPMDSCCNCGRTAAEQMIGRSLIIQEPGGTRRSLFITQLCRRAR